MTTIAHTDTTRPDGCYIQFARLIEPERCPDLTFLECATGDEADNAANRARLEAYENGEFDFVGVRAQARCLIVNAGVGTYVNLESAGLWGIESDSGEDYLNEVYAEELDALKEMLGAFNNPTFEEGETK